MACHATWLFGAVLIAYNVGNIMTDPVPKNQEASRHLFNGMKQFSQEFYQKANGETGNLICSPLSATIILAMAAFGARGNTEKQMRAGLHMHDDDSFSRYTYQKLIDSFADSQGIELKLANKIFLGDGVEMKPDFKDITEKDFRSTAETVDFSNGAQAAGTINNWASEKTNNRIKQVVKADDVQDASLVMVNALYFKGDWISPFKGYMTQPKPFHVDATTKKDVPTMYQQTRFNYGTLPDYDAIWIELPYSRIKDSDSTSMFIILPNKVDGLKKVEDNMHQLNLREMCNQQGSRLINLWLPKFKIESTIKVDDIIQKLGMTDMFTNDADFTGIAEKPAMKVSKVVQKAFIEVNEKGSEAAAVTAIVAVPMSAPVFVTPPLDVKVDHPFAFIIYHYETDTNLFQGHITSPTQ